MSDYGSFARRGSFEPALLPHAALAGVRTRRLLAFCLDFLLVSLIATLVGIVLFVATLGLSLFFHLALWPLVAFFYNGVTVSGRRMATPGMRVFDLQLRTVDGYQPSFLQAAVHGLLLYVSWLFPAVFLVALVAPEKRCLHDFLAGLIAVRRPD